ncbi:periplasmic heavy metal sensor [Halomonas sp. ZH2S]|uniref:Periplasmic heavy metal sensor n=1 Tax=Vreelandella zhuhanensis TaxID=2684210 RepID=A0A7X3H1U1_9GAMM|nr:Spy/CpxP family protein refolding chaperone [Halomonas zhuhanensis]MWJ28804.1 periplasmic heavy metal sensor [Halomonas zhuhanensis]
MKLFNSLPKNFLKRFSKQALALGLAVSFSAGSSIVLAQGMMGGGQGGGQGMHQGMMGGGQGGMGPGMMGGGKGMGPGMMGGMMDMPCPMMGGMDGMDSAGMGMMLQADPEQREQLRALKEEYRPAQFARMGRLMNLRDEMMAAMHQSRPDPEEVEEIHSRMAELRGEMLVEHIRHRNEMMELLSDEQRQNGGSSMQEGMSPSAGSNAQQ